MRDSETRTAITIGGNTMISLTIFLISDIVRYSRLQNVITPDNKLKYSPLYSHRQQKNVVGIRSNTVTHRKVAVDRNHTANAELAEIYKSTRTNNNRHTKLPAVINYAATRIFVRWTLTRTKKWLSAASTEERATWRIRFIAIAYDLPSAGVHPHLH